MIDSKQFRRGNLVMAAGRLSRMDTINETDCLTEAIDPSVEADMTRGLELIPLTEEWLVRLGFVKDAGMNELEKGQLVNYCVGDQLTSKFARVCFHPVGGFTFQYRGTPIRKVKFVHSLQNVFFEITEAEFEMPTSALPLAPAQSFPPANPSNDSGS